MENTKQSCKKAEPCPECINAYEGNLNKCERCSQPRFEQKDIPAILSFFCLIARMTGADMSAPHDAWKKHLNVTIDEAQSNEK